jgi:hypothetical protein
MDGDDLEIGQADYEDNPMEPPTEEEIALIERMANNASVR